MKAKAMNHLLLKTLAAGMLAVPAHAPLAAPPATSPYNTDLSYSENKDATAKALSVINVIACFIRAMAPEVAYNTAKGEPYVALIDTTKCDSEQVVSDNSAGLSVETANYATAVVQSTLTEERALDNRIWLTWREEDGRAVKTWVRARVNSGPTETLPLGDWEVHYCDANPTNPGVCDSHGFARVDATGSRAYSFDRGSWGENERSVISNIRADQASGGGKFAQREVFTGGGGGNSAGYYAFDTNRLYANLGSDGEQCLIPDSSAPGAKAANWETWLYDASTGARVDTNSGFSIRRSDRAGEWGWAGYSGVSFGSGLITDGEEFIRVGNLGESLGTYRAIVAPGKLHRIDVGTATLNQLAGLQLKGNIPKQVLSLDTLNLNGSPIDTGAISAAWVNISFRWDATAGAFIVDSYEVCGNSGCTPTAISGSFTLAQLTSLASPQINNLWAWQEGTGNGYNIIVAEWRQEAGTWERVAFNAAQVVVKSRRTTVVSGGDTSVPSSLRCVGWACVDANLVKLEQSPTTSPPTYAWNSGAYTLSAGGNSITFNADHYWSGVLVPEASLAQLACQDGAYCEWLADQNLATYYRWESGPGTWNRYTAVRDLATDTVVSFDPPLNVRYTVPGDDPSAYAGRTVTIQYPGAGRLWVPGYCFDPATRERKPCGASTEWANEFTIPFDTEKGVVTLAGGSRQYLVKNLRRGVYYPDAPLGDCSALKAAADPYSGATLPTVADWKNPAAPDSTTYTGPWRDAEQAPLIIHGKLQ